jgi:hypothetical protein
MSDHVNTTPTPERPPNSAPGDTVYVAKLALTKKSINGHVEYALSTIWS